MSRRKIVVVDTETDLTPDNNKGGPCKRASPWHNPGLEVYRGLMVIDVDGGTPAPACHVYTKPLAAWRKLHGNTLYVGHNIGFDLHVITRGQLHTVEIHEGAMIWDTQTAAYYLSGQSRRFPSLDELSALYGLPVKDSKITDLFKKGVGAGGIPYKDIAPYLRQDVSNTFEIFTKQWEQAVKLNMLPFLRQMMDAQLHAMVMEAQGLAVDGLAAKQFNDAWHEVYTASRGKTTELMRAWMPDAEHEPNPDSPQQVRKLLTEGQTYRTRKRVPAGKYKNGKDKFVIQTGVARPRVPWNGVPSDELTDTTEAGLSKLRAKLPHLSSMGVFIDELLSFRYAAKQLKTYGQGYLGKMHNDGRLRTSYLHSSTPTGRVTSSNPNLQNLPRSRQ